MYAVCAAELIGADCDGVKSDKRWAGKTNLAPAQSTCWLRFWYRLRFLYRSKGQPVGQGRIFTNSSGVSAVSLNCRSSSNMYSGRMQGMGTYVSVTQKPEYGHIYVATICC